GRRLRISGTMTTTKSASVEATPHLLFSTWRTTIYSKDFKSAPKICELSVHLVRMYFISWFSPLFRLVFLKDCTATSLPVINWAIIVLDVLSLSTMMGQPRFTLAPTLTMASSLFTET
ncbi:unnamed protein product, partial [Nesidiocoris tenuis]